MSFNFPNNPAPGDIYAPVGGPSWRFESGAWAAATAISLPVIGLVSYPPYVTLIQLKALDTITIKCAIRIDVAAPTVMFWRVGDFASRIDDIDFVKADAVSATAGAWVNMYVGMAVSAGTGNAHDTNWIGGNRNNVFGGGDANTMSGGTASSPNKLTDVQNLRCNLGGYDQTVEAVLVGGIISSPHSIIRAASDHATIVGGSTHEIIAGSYNFIGGGTNIEINGGINAVVGGQDIVVAGGAYNLASGFQTTMTAGNANIVTGYQNQNITGSYGVVFGRGNTKSADYNFTFGYRGSGRTHGGMTLAGGFLAALGDSQSTVVHVKGQTTSATGIQLTSADNNQFLMFSPDDATVGVLAYIVARDTANGDSKFWRLECLLSREAGSTAAVAASAATVIAADAGAATWTVSVNPSAGTAGVRIAAAGEAAKTINWSGRVTLIEVTG